MSADIQKLAVFDSRVVQTAPKYAVEKGALSLTNSPFNAIASTTSQHTYNIYVPSENVYVDRLIRWSSSCFQQFNVGLANIPAPGEALVVPGRDFALQRLPLNSLCSTLTATINDTTSVINTQDVLDQVLRLCDYKPNRRDRTCPTMLDKYQSYNDAFGTINNPLAGYSQGALDTDIPNGAFQGLVFTDNAGSVLGTTADLRTPAFTGAAYCAASGVPVAPEQWNVAFAYAAGQIVQSAGSVWLAVAPVLGTAPVAPAWTQVASLLATTAAAPGGGNAISNAGPLVYVRWRSTEPIVLSPFVFADEHEWDTGLFGINNIQLVMNLVSNPSRSLRTTTRGGRFLSSIAYNTGITTFQDSQVNVQFLTPPFSAGVELPAKSVVPYMEFPRYISQAVSIPAGTAQQLQSQTITLPQIPDLLIIYAKPTGSYANTTDADFLFPVANFQADGVRNPISINFDNFSGLLSSHTAEELYAMSVKNGLDMDWETWSGLAVSAAGGYTSTQINSIQAGLTRTQGQRVPLVGGPLVLKPSQDLTLQNGQAPSLVGNFTLQFNITMANRSSVAQSVQLYVITANSGFFESIRGSSRIIKGVLSEQDVLSAPVAACGTRADLERMVGAGTGGLSFGSLSNILSKAKDVYHATKPAISAIKGMLPEEGRMGKVRGALSAIGYGTGGEMGCGTGGGTGAGTGGRRGMKKSLEARLM
jgi:hypothetical protein